VKVDEGAHQYHILQAEVQRQKDGSLQNIAIYPHRDGVLEDYYFSLIYLLVMIGSKSIASKDSLQRTLIISSFINM
jgi:hypothetical protein